MAMNESVVRNANHSSTSTHCTVDERVSYPRAPVPDRASQSTRHGGDRVPIARSFEVRTPAQRSRVFNRAIANRSLDLESVPMSSHDLD